MENLFNTLFCNFSEMRNTNDSFILKSDDKILHNNAGDHQIVCCPICNLEIVPYWEPRYNGVRASCSNCGINWQES